MDVDVSVIACIGTFVRNWEYEKWSSRVFRLSTDEKERQNLNKSSHRVRAVDARPMERRPETERPRRGIRLSRSLRYTSASAPSNPPWSPPCPDLPSTRAKPIEELSGEARVQVADDLRHAYPATYKALEFIRSRAPHLLRASRRRTPRGRRRRRERQARTTSPVGASELWDRTPIGPPLHVGARQHIPLLKLTPDVTILLASIAAEVTSEANEARRLRALEGAAEESGDEDDDRSSSLRFYRRAHLAGVLSTRHVEFDDHAPRGPRASRSTR